jgi:hypothetical protein
MKTFTKGKGRQLKLGVISNEFFDVNVGRMGGFGWAAATVARCFGEEPQLGQFSGHDTNRILRISVCYRLMHIAP